MHRYIFPFVLMTLLFTSPFGCGGGEEESPSPVAPSGPAFNTPSLLSFISSEIDVQKILNLVAKLEVLKADDLNGTPVKELDLQVQFVPENPNLPNSPTILQIIPAGGLKVSGLSAGDYLFQINLFHRPQSGEDIKIAFIEAAGTIVASQDTPIDFSQSQWRYDIDDDGEGYANITELMNGHFETQQGDIGSTKIWISEPTDPKDPNSHPNGISIIDSTKIGTTSPSSTGIAKVVGETLSVPSGTLITITHQRVSDNSQETVQVFSRVDGSFEATLTNSGQGDTVSISLASLPATSETQVFGSESPLQLSITFVPLKVEQCSAGKFTPGVDRVEIRGKGFGPTPEDNEVIFPPFAQDFQKGRETGGISATDVSIASLGVDTITLSVLVPEAATSGFPVVHNRARGSFGRCNRNNDVIIVSQNQILPDLFVDYWSVPQVALIGQQISIDMNAVNQGQNNVSQPSFSFATFLSGDSNENISSLDREIFPNSNNLVVEADPSFEEITTLGSNNVFRTTLNFLLRKVDTTFLSGSSSFVRSGPRFKAEVDKYQQVPEGNGDNNNVTTALHSTYIHYVDLDIRDIQNNLTQNQPGQSHPISFNFNGQTLNASSIDPQPPIELKHGPGISLELGKIQNLGTFPLIRQKKSDGSCCDYMSKDPSSSSDPLDTTQPVYQEAAKLASQIDFVNGVQDLFEQDALDLINKANLLNQKTELPVRVHVVYSPDDKLDSDDPSNPKNDQPIICKGCEFCVNRLEQEADASNNDAQNPNQSFYKPDNLINFPADKIDLSVALDTGAIPVGSGNLFVVTEALKIDPNKVQSNGIGFNYCGFPETPAEQKASGAKANRQDINEPLTTSTGTDPTPKPLIDFSDVNSVIRIPIVATAPDLVLEGITLSSNTGSNTVNLDDTITVGFNIRNNGTQDIPSGTSIPIKFGIYRSGEADYNNLKGSQFNKTLPNTLMAHGSNTIHFDQFLTISSADSSTIPLGLVNFFAIVDFGDSIYEANGIPGNGENNNRVDLASALNIQAADLIIRSAELKADNPTTGANFAAGNTYTLSVTLENLGSADVNVPSGIPISAKLGSTDLQLVQPGLTQVQANSTASGDYKFQIPSNLAAGTYLLTLQVNPSQAIAESNFTNNSFLATSPITTHQIALQVTVGTLQFQTTQNFGVAGESITVTPTITNNSDIALNVSVSAQLIDSQGNTVVDGTPSSLNIPSNNGSQTTLTVTIPNGTFGSGYKIRVNATVVDATIPIKSVDSSSFSIHIRPVVTVDAPTISVSGSNTTIDLSGICSTTETNASLSGQWTVFSTTPNGISCNLGNKSQNSSSNSPDTVTDSCTSSDPTGSITFRLTCMINGDSLSFNDVTASW
jgi:hypothetical protein